MDEKAPAPPQPMVRILGRIVDDGIVELDAPWPATAAAHAVRDAEMDADGSSQS